MLIGHAPAGYLWTRLFLRLTRSDRPRDSAYKTAMVFGLAASILPDFDMLYFFFIDGRQHGHHSYWTHLPVFWLCVMAVWFAYAGLRQRRRAAYLGAVAGTNLLLHLLLDTFASRLQWLYPFSDRYFNLVRVPALYDSWIVSFILHWTFLVEVLLAVTANIVFCGTWRGENRLCKDDRS